MWRTRNKNGGLDEQLWLLKKEMIHDQVGDNRADTGN